jgi:hypothetical protein
MKYSFDIWQIVTLIALLTVVATLVVRKPSWCYLLLSLAWTMGVVIKVVLITVVVNSSSLTVAIAAAALIFLGLLFACVLFDKRGRFVLVAQLLTACGIIGVEVWTLA